MATLIGQISHVQEGQFCLNDNTGVAHQFTLVYDAHVPNPGLHNLQKEGTKVLVTYTKTNNGYTGIVHRVRPL